MRTLKTDKPQNTLIAVKKITMMYYEINSKNRPLTNDYFLDYQNAYPSLMTLNMGNSIFLKI